MTSALTVESVDPESVDMTRTPARTTGLVPADHARSWQLVSGIRRAAFQEAARGEADAVIFDLEDGVIPAAKPEARENVREWLLGSGRGWVRVNNTATPDWAIDLAAVGELPGLDGVMLAKCESADQIADTARRLPAGTPVIALIESALGIEHAFAIAGAPGTRRLAFGSGDFRRDTGAGDDPTALSYARSRLVVASRAAGIAGPVDGPTLPSGNTSLLEDIRISQRLGMTGKLCMRTVDTSVVNDAFRPSIDELRWALTVVEELGENGERVRDGSDLPKLARAQKLRGLADIFGQLRVQQTGSSRG